MLSEDQVTEVFRTTAKPPLELEASTKMLVAQLLDFGPRTVAASAFGVKVSAKFLEVPVFLLPPPKIDFFNTKAMSVANWRDDLKCKFIEPATIHSIGLINFAGNRADPNRFLSSVIPCLLERGLKIVNANSAATCQDANPRGDPREAIRAALAALQQRMAKPPTVLFFILPFRDSIMYSQIKRFCDSDIGIISQVVLGQKIERAKPSYFANLSLKINAKIGGGN